MEESNSNMEEVNNAPELGLRSNVKTALLIGIPSTLILFVLLYFLVLRPSFSERQAQIFCDCTSTISESSYIQSEDGFEYLSDINTCFGEQFSTYADGMTLKKKKIYLYEIQKSITEKCPEKLSYVFK